MIRPFHQIHLKILALVAAITLWFIVITVENTVYKFPEQINVEIINLETNLSLEEALPKVDVFLRVSKEDLTQLTKNDLEVFIDMSDIEAGGQKVKIEASSKSALAKVLKVEPEEIRLKISPVIEKEVEVRTVVEGDPAGNYKIESTEIEIEKVMISGAQNIVDEIEYVEAKVILDGTQTEDIDQTVALVVPETLGISSDLITITPEEMTVSTTIAPSIQQKDVKVEPNFISESDYAAFIERIIITPETISVNGDDSDLGKLSSIETSTIEVSVLIRNRKVEVSLDLPKGITLTNPSQKIEIKLIEKDLGTEPTI